MGEGLGLGLARHLLRCARGQPRHGRARLSGAEAQLELQDQAAHVRVERVHLPSRQAAQLCWHIGGVAPDEGQVTITVRSR